MSDTPRTDRWIKNCNGWHHVSVERARELERELAEANERILNLRTAIAKSQEEITQICGKALGYSWYKDDQKNFPGATEKTGVCVGEHVAETIVAELADKYAKANERIKRLEAAGDALAARLRLWKTSDGNWLCEQDEAAVSDWDKAREATP